ncbi:hypothetical protein EV188_1011138 [Actinomycetospora succinea]|uniref:Uncharacterized protein n=1 Tax=Actinomycetospora succinea TaxID=663603 RepID=A0A4R6VTB2_9PSEU|nr:hypothetical protein [Actinomycetospora succinea]TDQ65886.1 hypothetical protein EV188_1011138 [Actinomycetospora succinea]
MATVGFLHVAAEHVREARRLLAEHAPGVVDVHLVDRNLLTPGPDIATRVAARVGELVGRDVDAVICTWPYLTDLVVRVARERGLAAAGVEELMAPAGGVLALSR